MSNERHETVADNVSVNHQFREVAKMIPHEEVAVSKMETTTPTGNSAAMREALEQIHELLSIGGMPDTAMCIRYEAAHLIAKEALSAPSRNCDVGTEQEQFERFDRWCNSRELKKCCGVCCRKCLIAWSQMPYEEVKK